jgi:hypothetical protein
MTALRLSRNHAHCYAGLFALFCAGASGANKAGNGDAPKIVCDEPVFSFSAHDKSGPVVHWFLIRNEGTAPLVIEQVKSAWECGCGNGARADDKAVAPGDGTTVQVKLPLHGERGRIRRVWHVESNDPDTPRFELVLDGKIKTLSEVCPRTVQFGEITPAVRAEQSVEVSSPENTAFQITNVLCSVSNVRAVCERVDARRHRIKICTQPPLECGLMRGEVTLLTDNALCDKIVIPVLGEVFGPMIFSPSALQLNAPDRKAQVYYIAVASRARVPFSVIKVESPDPKAKISWKPLSGDSYLLCIEGMESSETLEGKNLVVITDQGGAERIPIQIIPF